MGLRLFSPARVGRAQRPVEKRVREEVGLKSFRHLASLVLGSWIALIVAALATLLEDGRLTVQALRHNQSELL